VSDLISKMGGCTLPEKPVMTAEPSVKKRVLIIDDDASIRMLLEMGFRLRGYDCMLAENGLAAQPLVLSEHFDAILVDLMMPMMDGLSFIHWLREAASNQTPVLVLTSVHSATVSQEVIEAGANGLALKPIRIPQILEELKKLIAA
jgi:two-component system response regulator MprA